MEDYCQSVYELWVYFGGIDLYVVSHYTVCTEWVPTATKYFPNSIWVDVDRIGLALCFLLILNEDYNNDRHMNFRYVTNIYI